jgi:hypothetical protein
MAGKLKGTALLRITAGDAQYRYFRSFHCSPPFKRKRCGSVMRVALFLFNHSSYLEWNDDI